MTRSKLTTKSRTTIPRRVRAAPRLKEGDEIVYAIEAERVFLTNARPGSVDDPFAIFGEWGGAADRNAYGEL